MKLHIVDGTYELFRAHFAQPTRLAPDGMHVSAIRGLIISLMSLINIFYCFYFDYLSNVNSYVSVFILSLIIGSFFFIFGKKNRENIKNSKTCCITTVYLPFHE